jgi:hypothetical protein
VPSGRSCPALSTGSLQRKAWVIWQAYALRNRMLKDKLTRFAIAMGAKSTRKVFEE